MIYHKYIHVAVSRALNGKPVYIMLEFVIFQGYVETVYKKEALLESCGDRAKTLFGTFFDVTYILGIQIRFTR